MNKAPAYQRYPDKWLADTRRLSWAAKGMYADLLDVIWLQFQDTCSIPNDDKFIAAELGASLEDWAAAKLEILDPRRPLLMVSPDGKILFSNGLMKESEKQKEWRRKSSNGGKKSAKKRWPKSLRVCKGGSQMVTECLQPNGNIPTPSPSPIPIKNISADKQPKVTWLTPYAKIWESRCGGEMPIGPAAKFLAPLNKKHGTAVVCDALDKYLSEAGKFASIPSFASKFGLFTTKPPTKPIYDADENLRKALQ